MRQDRVEERLQVLPLLRRVEARRARAAGTIHDRAVELLVRRVELQQQFQHLVRHFVRPGVRAVDLVDDDDDFVV